VDEQRLPRPVNRRQGPAEGEPNRAGPVVHSSLKPTGKPVGRG
jgi:hypothetical protein